MARKGVLIGLLVAVLASTAWAFQPYFSDASGRKIGTVWEGQQIYVAIKDPDKGACGIDQFRADFIIFDFKTGAHLAVEGAWFRELGGIGSGLYFFVTRRNSMSKVAIQVGSRFNYDIVPEGQTHVLGTSLAGVLIDPEEGVFFATAGWIEGAWEYVDEDFANAGLVAAGDLPQNRTAARVNFAGETPNTNALPAGEDGVWGRFENNNTLVLIVRDRTDERNIDQDQVKIADTVAKLTVTPARLDYGCGPACSNIVVKIEDKDENLNCNAIEYVPFFVIINPGSWNPTFEAPVTNFCSLMLRGGNFAEDQPYDEPIRWYNIYEPERYIQYGNARWWNPTWATGDVLGFGANVPLLRAVFFAAETSVDTGEFVFDFGNLNDLQRVLGLDPDDRLPRGTTIAFYYIDPNDFDDMDLATVQVGDAPRSQTFITDANGIPVQEVRLGVGRGGLYVRVYDADANVEACCQDKIVVHICDPHNEDDGEYYIIDETSNASGIFFTQSGIQLLPVWDAVSGYQLVFDDWKIQAYNEDTIFVRYNSVDYAREWLNALGDGDANDGLFPPAILDGMEYVGEQMGVATRNQYWDVSFAKVKVYDYQVFNGSRHDMKFLDGQYREVTTIPVSGSLYLEVTDLDQDEHPGLRELIFGGWNKDRIAADDDVDGANEDSMPIWGRGRLGVFNSVLGPLEPFRDETDPVLWPTSISGIPETVKVFMFNPQRGTWERMDLRETAVGSGVFRSTTCVLVSAASVPVGGFTPGDSMGHLWSKPGDTIMAFYQDPSNHSDVAIISIKVNEGGAGEITPPAPPQVAFDRTTYNPGDTVTITVTDGQYAGANEISGASKVLVLKKGDGTELTSWTNIPVVTGEAGKFRVSYVLPAGVTGTIIAVYTDPNVPTRTAQTQATVGTPTMTGVSKVEPVPDVITATTPTVFTVFPTPAGAVASRFKVTVYDLTGKKVWEDNKPNTNTITWNGGNLRNGAYIYVAEVSWPGGSKVFKGFVYIKR